MAPRRVELWEVELPELSDGLLLVATEWSGSRSGTELLAYRGEVDPDLPLDETMGALTGTFTYPFRYGYSAVGRVVQPAVPFREGQRVFAFHPHQDRFVADAREVVAVDDLDPRAATLYPDGRDRPPGLPRPPRLGETVVAVGLGAVGILVAVLLARTGAVVLGSDPSRPGRPPPGPSVSGPSTPTTCPRWWPPRPGGAAPTWWSRSAGTRRRWRDPSVCWPTREQPGSAPCTAPSRCPCPSGPRSTAGGWRCAALAGLHLPAALTARWDRRRRAELAWRLAREPPPPVLATHAFAFEQAAEAQRLRDRKEGGLIHAALRYE